MIVMHYNSDGDVVYRDVQYNFTRKKNIINACQTKNKTSTYIIIIRIV